MTPKHIQISLMNTRDRKTKLKAAISKKKITCKEQPLDLQQTYQPKSSGPKVNGGIELKKLNEMKASPRIL